MALSDFVPLVGSGFDQLANQRLQWEQFNANIENQNLARAAQAETRADNWLAQVAEMNQRREEENFQRQLDADAYGRQLALTQQTEATRQRERGEDIKRAQEQFKSQMDYGKNYLDTQQKLAKEKIDAAAKNKELILDAQGQHLAANYQGLQNNQQQTAAALEDLHTKLDKVQNDLDTERGKGKKADANKILALQQNQKLYTAALRQREADARAAENKFNALVNRAENARFEINDDGSITHPETSKTWNWKNALKAAKAAAGGQQYPGPIGPTETAPAEEPSTDLSGVLFKPPVIPPEMAGGTVVPWGGFRAATAESQTPMIMPQMPAPAEGTLVRNKRTGQLARVVGGEAVTFGGTNAD